MGKIQGAENIHLKEKFGGKEEGGIQWKWNYESFNNSLFLFISFVQCHQQNFKALTLFDDLKWQLPLYSVVDSESVYN